MFLANSGSAKNIKFAKSQYRNKHKPDNKNQKTIENTQKLAIE